MRAYFIGAFILGLTFAFSRRTLNTLSLKKNLNLVIRSDNSKLFYVSCNFSMNMKSC